MWYTLGYDEPLSDVRIYEMSCEERGMITNILFLTDRLSVRLLNIGPIEIFLDSCLVGVRPDVSTALKERARDSF